ncbi:MAG: hypothetical protein ACOC80_12985 [Petrotogales bacterium]
MATKANVIINEKEYFIGIDGYPDLVIPSLRELVKDVKHFAKNHNFSFQRALKILSDENTGQYHLFSGRGHGFAEFEYYIGPRGGVYWRKYNNISWRV